MKLVQFLRPLFLVALGLHGLVMFLPTGEGEVINEDIALEELSAEQAASAKPPVPGSLPVPDPNVSTAAKPKAAPAASSPSGVAARPPVNPRAAASSAAKASASARARRNAASGSGGEGRASGGSASSGNDSSDRNANNQSSSQGNASEQNNSTIRNQNSEDESNQEAERSSGETTIAVVRPQNNNDANGEDSDTDEATNASALRRSRATELIAQATRNLPTALSELAAKLDRSLTYNPTNTDDISAQKAKDDWQAELQRQANVGPIESLPPAEIDELRLIDYPIESSLVAEGRSLRRCLTEDPKVAEIGVRFDAGGNVSGEPILLRSTGYSALNEEIKAMAAAYDDFPSDRASKAYTFEVEIFYDSDLCITAEDMQE